MYLPGAYLLRRINIHHELSLEVPNPTVNEHRMNKLFPAHLLLVWHVIAVGSRASVYNFNMRLTDRRPPSSSVHPSVVVYYLIHVRPHLLIILADRYDTIVQYRKMQNPIRPQAVKFGPRLDPKHTNIVLRTGNSGSFPSWMCRHGSLGEVIFCSTESSYWWY